MATVHSELLELFGRWRAEIDVTKPVLGFDVAALRARARAHANRFPTITHEVCEIRDTAAAADKAGGWPAFLTPETVGTDPMANPGPTWIPDELWPSGATG